MATLYVSFKKGCEGPSASSHEKLTISGTAAVSVGSMHNRGVIELYTDTVCEVSIGVGITDTTRSPFYIGPGIRYDLECGDGCLVAVKTA